VSAPPKSEEVAAVASQGEPATELATGSPSGRPVGANWAVRAATVAARPEAVLAGMIVAYVVVFGRLTWLHQSNFGTFGFDQGIFDQQIWLASRFKQTFITVRGLDMWANHVNPSVYLLVPFYWLGAGPHFLSLVQTIVLALGAVPLWLLARDRFGNSWLTLGPAAAWLLYPSLQWMTWWHFHPEALSVTPLLFAWWFAGRRRWGWYALCVVLVLAAKEDTALAILALGLVVALRHHRVAGLLTTMAAAGWLVTCFKVIIPAAGLTTPFYSDQYPTLGTTINQIVYNAVRHPSRLLRLAFNRDRYDYYVRMLAPVAGLALLAPVVLLIALPTMLENVANNQGYPHNYRFQYQALVAAGIFLATVEAIARTKRPGFRQFQVGLLCACAFAANVVWSPSPLDAKTYHSGIWAVETSAHTRAMDRAVHLVPAAASVSASYTAVPHLTHRTVVYEWPIPWIRANYGVEGTALPDPAGVQYIILDTGLNPGSRGLFDCLTGVGGPFRILFDREGAVLAKRVVTRGPECSGSRRGLINRPG
jgi:uncharacterized membrane protein